MSLVAEGLDRADVGEGLLSDSVHLTLLRLDGALQCAHPSLIEDREENERNDAGEGHTGEGWRENQHDDQHCNDEEHASHKH